MTTNYARWFPVVGSLYLLIGIGLGMFMGGSGDHTLSPLHAHINLVGFVLMTLFGILFRVVPGLGSGVLAALHFWLFQIGALGLVVSLYLLISRTAPEATVGPVIMIAEMTVFAALAAFVLNLWRHA